MKKTNTNAIVFAQVKGNTKRVVATRNGETVYVAHALLTADKPIWEALGGTRVEGEKGLYIDFPTAKKAKDFIAQAITHIDAKDYNKARKTEPKKVEKKASTPAKAEKKASVPAPKKAKGKTEFKFTTVTDADGNTFVVPTSVLEPVKATAPKKTAKGKAKADKPTTAPNAKAKKAEKSTPKKSKGNCKVDFSKLAGKGKSANKDAAALMRKAGITDGTSAEYKAVWAEWCKVR